MKSILNILSISAALVVVGGCACKNQSRGTVQHSSVRTSCGHMGAPWLLHDYHGKESDQATDAPASMHSRTSPPVRLTAGRPSDAMGPMTPPPPEARDGECWSSVYYPPKMQTTTERVCLKEPSERFEVTPAEYEWVEERVCVREASKQYVVEPAKYETVTQTILVDSGHTDWTRADESRCRAAGGQQPSSDVFCAVNYPKVEKTVTVERLVKPASLREVDIPAEYQTVRRQRCVKPASHRRVEIPGEYTTVEKTVELAPGRWEWQRVQCEGQAAGQPLSGPRKDVRKTGYTP